MTKPERQPMTVGRLIDLLTEFPPTLPVMVDGYEAGVQAPVAPKIIIVQRLEWGGGMFGDYEEETTGEPVVYLSRNHPRNAGGRA